MGFRLGAGLVLAGVLGWTGVAQADPAGDPGGLAAKFGARVGIEWAAISPDGNRLVLIVPEGEGERVMVGDFVAGGAPRTVLINPNGFEHVRNCRWPSDTRLFCQVLVQDNDGGIGVSFVRLIALDADGGHQAVVTPRASFKARGYATHGGGVIDWIGARPGEVLMERQFVPEHTAGSNIASQAEGLGVESVNITTLERHTVEQPRKTADLYITDGQGHVRVVGLAGLQTNGYLSGKRDYLYRKPGEAGWNPLSQMSNADGGATTGFAPVAVDPVQNVAYGFGTAPNGRRAVYAERLDGSDTRTLVLGRDDVDVDELVTIGRHERVIGVSYATDRRAVEIFDPGLKRLQAALGRALPDVAQISFLDSSDDESRILLQTGGDTTPGMLYRLDRKAGHLEQVLPVRPELEGVKLAPMKPVTFRAKDGTMIPGYLTLPVTGPQTGLPAIVMPHGGPSARDEWGFDWLVQFFAARGYAVLQPNFRGSAGYGAGWFLHNGFRSWPVAIGDIDDAGRWLVAQGIAAPGHLAIVGWSYGGYAALQSGVADPGLFKAIVAIAPVTDLARLRDENLRYMGGMIVDREIGHGDEVEAGSPALHAGQISVPVLMFHGDHDLNVNIGHSREMAANLRQAGKRVDLVEFKGLDHQIESSTARATMLSRSDAFLRAALGLQ